MAVYERRIPMLLPIATALVLLGGCTTQTAPSSYDLFSDRFRADSATECERYAYRSGRSRFESLETFNGEAWAASNANRTAETAFEYCLSRRGSRS